MSLFSCMSMTRRPRWDEHGGIWYARQGTSTVPNENEVATIVPTRMYRYKPSISSICGPLMGSSVRDAAGTITGVRFPPLAIRTSIYREALELVHVFREYEDLFTLAVYRRQVCEEGLVIDQLFIELADAAGFTPAQWRELSLRMPDGSPIRRECERRGREHALIAAE